MAIYLGTNNLAGLGGGSREDHNGTTTSLSFPDISYMPALVVTSSGRSSTSSSATLADAEISGGSLDTSSSDYFTHTIPNGTGAVTNQDILNITNANGGALTNLVIKTGSSIYTASSTTNTLGRPAITIDFIVDGTTTTYVTPSSTYTGGLANTYYTSYQFISFGGFNLFNAGPQPSIESGSMYAYAQSVDAPLLTTYPNFNRSDGLPGGGSGFINTSFTNNMVRTTLDQLSGPRNNIMYTFIQNPVKYHWTFGFPWLKFNSTLQIKISVPSSSITESGSIVSTGLKHTF
tara:strand:- start:516 stop:1385 length:870 start_codon:yes stop_codon:yes gene_type:complete